MLTFKRLAGIWAVLLFAGFCVMVATAPRSERVKIEAPPRVTAPKTADRLTAERAARSAQRAADAQARLIFETWLKQDGYTRAERKEMMRGYDHFIDSWSAYVGR